MQMLGAQSLKDLVPEMVCRHLLHIKTRKLSLFLSCRLRRLIGIVQSCDRVDYGDDRHYVSLYISGIPSGWNALKLYMLIYGLLTFEGETVWKDNIILEQYIRNTGILIMPEKKT